MHDSTLLEATLKRIVVSRPKRRREPTETLCLDAGCVGYPVLVTSRKQNYLLKVKTRRQESDDKVNNPQHKARRWVVERTHSWFNRFRKLRVSFEKTEASYFGLLSLASAMIYWRQTVTIYG